MQSHLMLNFGLALLSALTGDFNSSSKGFDYCLVCTISMHTGSYESLIVYECKIPDISTKFKQLLFFLSNYVEAEVHRHQSIDTFLKRY